jgi:hypothetical protein
MLHVSFAMTSEAFADGSKTETRRFWKASHAAKFKPGVEFCGLSKDFRAGGIRLHVARVVFCRLEWLGDMSEDSFEREGGRRYWANRAAYIEAMGGKDRVPYVLRFEHLVTGTCMRCSEMTARIPLVGCVCERCAGNPVEAAGAHRTIVLRSLVGVKRQ